MDWVKKGTATSLQEVIEKKSGVSISELLNPRPVPAARIKGLADAAQRIRQALEDEEFLFLFGDYDADGITSIAILDLTLRRLGGKPVIRLPKRHSEGYGLSMRAVEECDEGLVITIDNGISAIEPVKAFREKGVSVVILDHHLPDKELPDADIIVDQHISPEESDRNSFRHYCGAGLALKLAELMLGYEQQVMDILTEKKVLLRRILNCQAVMERICGDPVMADILACSSEELKTARSTPADMEKLIDSNQAAMERLAGYLEVEDMVLPERDRKQAVENRKLLKSCTALAAIGTIADVVPLLGDNRRIVKQGIDYLKTRQQLIPGLLAILDMLELPSPDEHDVAFRIGPLLNAPGRLYDDGAVIALHALLEEDSEVAAEKVEDLIKTNAQRKSLVQEHMEQARKIIDDACKYGAAPVCVYDPKISEGILGILAGRLSEELRVPVLVFTDSVSDPDVIKGSGRSTEDVHLYDLLKPLEKHFIAFGGHAGAVGLSIRYDSFDEVATEIESLLTDYEFTAINQLEYDLEISGDNVKCTHEELERYAPFGEGNPMPVFLVKDITLSPRYGKHYKAMGADSSHLKLHGNGFDIIMFGKAQQYLQMGQPRKVDVVGTISEKQFSYSKAVQLQAEDYRRSKDNRPAESSLAVALEENRKLFA